MFYASKLDSGDFNRATLDILTADCFQLEAWNHPNLRAPYWRLYWNRSEGTWLEAKGRRIEMVPRKIYLVPPETDFATGSDASPMHFYVHFLTSGNWSGHEVIPFPASGHLQKEMREITARPSQSAHLWQIAALVTGALARLPQDGFERNRKAPSERIRQALRIIDSRLPEPVEVAAVAMRTGMNLNAFIRRFKEELGQTPARYQREKRIAAACLRLHHSEDSIERIAESCGFCDRHHFTRAFTKVRGMSPAAFRRLAVKTR